MMAMIPALMIKTKINSNKIKKEAKAHFLLSNGGTKSENELFDITTIPIVGGWRYPARLINGEGTQRGRVALFLFACVFG
jgi:hypothetical protein